MPYMIDGHNLIPRIPGLSLKSMDDEQSLIEILQGYCQIKRSSVEVYFDGAPPGQSRQASYGMVKAHFIRQGSSADAAIKARLQSMGKAARNWTVVTSDCSVQISARESGARVMLSEDFAAQIQALYKQAGKSIEKSGENRKLSESEIEEWMRLFRSRKP